MTSLSIDSSLSAANAAGINNAAANSAGDELSQADFIELLVAQVKHQDPTKPMDPSQFMNQLSQSSMVNGISELGQSFDSLATKLTSDQSLQAAGLVGRNVLVPGGESFLPQSGSLNGQINLDQTASDVNLKIYNSQGVLVRTLPMGGHNAGELQFKWDGFADDGSVSPQGHYLVIAEGLIDGTQQALPVSMETRIDSININQGSGEQPNGTLLNLAGGLTVSLDEVTQIK